MVFYGSLFNKTLFNTSFTCLLLHISPSNNHMNQSDPNSPGWRNQIVLAGGGANTWLVLIGLSMVT